MRTFIALPLAEPALSAALEFHQKLRDAITRQGVRFVAPDKLHLTLHFLGNVLDGELFEVSTVLRALAPTLSPVELTLDGLGAFPDMGRPKVVWVGVHGTGLHGLIAQVRAIGKYLPEADEKEFAPHLTLARVSPGSREVGRLLQPLLHAADSLSQWKAGCIQLIQTQPDGSYRVIEEFPLGG